MMTFGLLYWFCTIGALVSALPTMYAYMRDNATTVGDVFNMTWMIGICFVPFVNSAIFLLVGVLVGGSVFLEWWETSRVWNRVLFGPLKKD